MEAMAQGPIVRKGRVYRHVRRPCVETCVQTCVETYLRVCVQARTRSAATLCRIPSQSKRLCTGGCSCATGYGLYSYGLHSYGLYSYDLYIIMAYIVMAKQLRTGGCSCATGLCSRDVYGSCATGMRVGMVPKDVGDRCRPDDFNPIPEYRGYVLTHTGGAMP